MSTCHNTCRRRQLREHIHVRQSCMGQRMFACLPNSNIFCQLMMICVPLDDTQAQIFNLDFHPLDHQPIVCHTPRPQTRQRLPAACNHAQMPSSRASRRDANCPSCVFEIYITISSYLAPETASRMLHSVAGVDPATYLFLGRSNARLFLLHYSFVPLLCTSKPPTEAMPTMASTRPYYAHRGHPLRLTTALVLKEG